LSCTKLQCSQKLLLYLYPIRTFSMVYYRIYSVALVYKSIRVRYDVLVYRIVPVFKSTRLPHYTGLNGFPINNAIRLSRKISYKIAPEYTSIWLLWYTSRYGCPGLDSFSLHYTLCMFISVDMAILTSWNITLHQAISHLYGRDLKGNP
jgi:hypothetical protein